MTDLQQILSDIVDDMEETVAGLSVLAAPRSTARWNISRGGPGRANRGQANTGGLLNRIRKKIAALDEAPAKSDRKA